MDVSLIFGNGYRNSIRRRQTRNPGPPVPAPAHLTRVRPIPPLPRQKSHPLAKQIHPFQWPEGLVQSHGLERFAWRASVYWSTVNSGCFIVCRSESSNSTLMYFCVANLEEAISGLAEKTRFESPGRNKKGARTLTGTLVDSPVHTNVDPAVTDQKQPAVKSHWISPSGVRHNRSCRWYANTRNGRYCASGAGRACKQCGG